VGTWYGANGGFADKIGRAEVGLAEAQVDERNAFGAKLAAQAGHLDCLGFLNAVEALGKLHRRKRFC